MVDSRCEPNDIEPNDISYIILYGLCEEGKLKDGLLVWKNMVGNGCTPDVIAYSSMIKGLCMIGMVDGDMRMFNVMLARKDVELDVFSRNILFNGLLKDSKLPEAMDLLSTMLDMHCDPDFLTCDTFLKVLIQEEGKVRGFWLNRFFDFVKEGGCWGLLRFCMS